MDEETKNKRLEIENEINGLVRNTEAIDIIFNEPTNLLRDLTDAFDKDNYASILENGKKVLAMMEEPTQKFIKVGLAFSISAASKWLSILAEVGVDIGVADGLLSEARRQFAGGDFHSAGEAIGKVRDMFPKLEEEQIETAKEGISSAERIIEEAKNIGASVDVANRSLQQAKNFLEAENYREVTRFTMEAKKEAGRAREQRIQTISDALLFTRSIIDESREVGVNTSESLALYEGAKAAFDMGDFQKCSEMNREAEEQALKLQEEHIKKVLSLKERREKLMEERAEVEEAEPAAEEEEKPAVEEEAEPAVEEEAEPAAEEEEKPAVEEEAEPEEVSIGSEPITSEEPTAEEATEQEPKEEICPYCDSRMRYIEKYSRYWCNRCQRYAPKR